MNLGFTHSITIGSLDFYAPSIQLAVEVDGPIHNELDDMSKDLKLARLNVL